MFGLEVLKSEITHHLNQCLDGIAPQELTRKSGKKKEKYVSFKKTLPFEQLSQKTTKQGNLSEFVVFQDMTTLSTMIYGLFWESGGQDC